MESQREGPELSKSAWTLRQIQGPIKFWRMRTDSEIREILEARAETARSRFKDANRDKRGLLAALEELDKATQEYRDFIRAGIIPHDLRN